MQVANTNQFAHIPTAVMVAINEVGTAHATLEKAYKVVARAFHEEKISSADTKTLIAMSLAHHMSKYAPALKLMAEGDRAYNDSALYAKVKYDFRTYVLGAKPVKASADSTVSIRIKATERAAYNAFLEACGDAKRMALVLKALK